MPCTSKEETESQAREPEDGLTREELFALYRGTSLTYDDLIMHPAHVGFGVENVDLSSRLSRNIALKTPLVSSPMDTVTESAMAIALALQGGIGIIHCNSAPEEQARQVAAVKRYNNGFIADPVSVRPDDTVRRVFELRRSCAFSCFPVTADGKAGSRLLGILSDRDLDFVTDESLKVSQVLARAYYIYINF